MSVYRPHGSKARFGEGCRCEACWRACPHGVRTNGFNWGCRCQVCIDANRAYHAAYRAKQGLSSSASGAAPSGYLAVNCWCEASIVGVTKADLLAGRTGSCGRHGCREAA